jgi:hypothetical protein
VGYGADSFKSLLRIFRPRQMFTRTDPAVIPVLSAISDPDSCNPNLSVKGKR